MPALTLAITLCGLGVTLVFAAAALRRGGRGDTPLGVLLVAVGVQMAANALIASRQILEWPHLGQLHVPWAFAIGPLAYAYARDLAGRPLTTRALLLNLAPSLLLAVSLLPFYLQPAGEKITFLSAAVASYPVEWRVRQAALVTQMGVYLAAAGMTAGWHVPFLRIAPLVWAVMALRFLFAYQADTATLATAVLGGALGLVVATNLASPPEKQNEEQDEKQDEKDPERPRTPITGAEGDACLAAVKTLFDRDRLYADRQLTLESLALAAGTSPHFLSRVVNERTGTSVPDFINLHRVEEVKRLLGDPSSEALGIWEIAERAGFSSRSSFNAAFRRHTGATPRAFRGRGRADS